MCLKVQSSASEVHEVDALQAVPFRLLTLHGARHKTHFFLIPLAQFAYEPISRVTTSSALVQDQGEEG